MDTLEVIKRRRSIRKYKSKSVPADLLDKILHAAMQAPSAHNKQPWCFIVITDSRKLSAIAQLHPYAEMLTEAPMAIAVCGDRRFETDDGYLALDCAAAAQNILLSATDLGLGTVWIGIYPRAERMTELKKITELPEYIIPINLIAVGFADEKKHPVDRYQSDRVFLNKYENLYNA